MPSPHISPVSPCISLYLPKYLPPVPPPPGGDRDAARRARVHAPRQPGRPGAQSTSPYISLYLPTSPLHLANRAEQVRNSAALRLALLRALLTRVVPLPLPLDHPHRSALTPTVTLTLTLTPTPILTLALAPNPSPSPKTPRAALCFWQQGGLLYETQTQLLRLLPLLAAHVLAAHPNAYPYPYPYPYSQA